MGSDTPAQLSLLTIIGNLSIPLYVFWLFDQLIKLEYSSHRSQWERDGKPCGFFWKPQEVVIKSFKGGLPSTVWLFVTPQWMRGDPRALPLLRRFRAATAFWNLACLTQFYMFFQKHGG